MASEIPSAASAYEQARPIAIYKRATAHYRRMIRAYRLARAPKTHPIVRAACVALILTEDALDERFPPPTDVGLSETLQWAWRRNELRADLQQHAIRGFTRFYRSSGAHTTWRKPTGCLVRTLPTPNRARREVRRRRVRRRPPGRRSRRGSDPEPPLVTSPATRWRA
jgi:hypothetical protein